MTIAQPRLRHLMKSPKKFARHRPAQEENEIAVVRQGGWPIAWSLGAAMNPNTRTWACQCGQMNVLTDDLCGGCGADRMKATRLIGRPPVLLAWLCSIMVTGVLAGES